jgi:class 3 adenylate cyclase
MLGVLTTFTVRDAHRGDEARRTVRAGLALVAAARQGDPAVHVGIEYGQVLVTPSWKPAQFGVWGRLVKVAQRLCDAAGPGELQIGPAAFALADTHVDLATPVRVRLKGITDAVVAHRTMRAECKPMAAGQTRHVLPEVEPASFIVNP